ncbi:MAG: amino acid racemase [Propionibacteriaceae bacterium]|jgi:aspartate racemase|nr:amino acid racemase [Propionibacteriaceae bacterium]
MKTIGIIGGMSYHSTVEYYMGINNKVAEALGGHASAQIILDSINFQPIRDMQVAEAWDEAGQTLAGHGRRLEAAGADAVAIGTNLMHKVAPAVEAAIGVPLIHIADAVAAQASRAGIERLGVMGTSWVMRENFYTDRLASHGITGVKASDQDADLVDGIIWSELTRGVVTESARQKLVGVIERLGQAGAEAVLLGCTELDLSLSSDVSPLPVIDSTTSHIALLAEFVLG